MYTAPRGCTHTCTLTGHRHACSRSSQALPRRWDTCVLEEQALSEVPGAPGSKPNSGGEAGELLPVPGWLGKSFRV